MVDWPTIDVGTAARIAAITTDTMCLRDCSFKVCLLTWDIVIGGRNGEDRHICQLLNCHSHNPSKCIPSGTHPRSRHARGSVGHVYREQEQPEQRCQNVLTPIPPVSQSADPCPLMSRGVQNHFFRSYRFERSPLPTFLYDSSKITLDGAEARGIT